MEMPLATSTLNIHLQQHFRLWKTIDCSATASERSADLTRRLDILSSEVECAHGMVSCGCRLYHKLHSTTSGEGIPSNTQSWIKGLQSELHSELSTAKGACGHQQIQVLGLELTCRKLHDILITPPTGEVYYSEKNRRRYWLISRINHGATLSLDAAILLTCRPYRQ